MEAYLLIKLVHILGAAVLFGTGAGIAFFMLMAHRTGEPATIAATARIVVVADFVFTASAVVLQPVTGALLAYNAGFSLLEPWILGSLVLYVLIGCCWLPVVGLQMRMRRLAEAAARSGGPLPGQYHRDFRLWFLLGWPAFLGVVLIYWLMIAKP